MLSTFRNHATGWAAKIMLALLILSFAAWGIPDMYRQMTTRAAVATVGSQKITMDAFERTLTRESTSFKEMLGAQYSPALLKQIGLPQQVLEKMINQSLLEQESHRLGLTPSDADVARLIRSNPNFQNIEGKFDKAIFAAALQQNGMNEAMYVDQLRRSLSIDAMLAPVTALSPLPDVALKTLMSARGEQRTADLYRFTPALIKDLPKPTHEQLTEYHKTHADEFTAPEWRKLSIIELEDAQDDLALQQKANRLEDALAGGSTLEEAAKEMNLRVRTLPAINDKGQTADGKSVALPRGENFVAAAFKLQGEGDSTLLPIKDGGFVLVHLDSLTSAQLQPLEKVIAKVAEGWTKEERNKRVQTLAEDAAKQAQQDVTALKKLGSSVSASGTVTRADTKALPSGLIKELFERKTGETTGAYVSNEGYVIAVVKTVTPAKPISDKELAASNDAELLRGTLTNNMRNELLEQYMRSLRTRYTVKIDEAALASALEER